MKKKMHCAFLFLPPCPVGMVVSLAPLEGSTMSTTLRRWLWFADSVAVGEPLPYGPQNALPANMRDTRNILKVLHISPQTG